MKINTDTHDKVKWAEIHSDLIDTFDKIRFDMRSLFTTISIIQKERDALREEKKEYKQEIEKLKQEIVTLKNKKQISKH